jgi:RNA polymerase sigma-70 factor (ECF subfamily)
MGPEAQAVQSEEQDVVQVLLNTLPEEYRETVILRYWSDMSYDEIADVMKTTVSAIKSRLFRARRQLADTGLEMGMAPSQEVEAVA